MSFSRPQLRVDPVGHEEAVRARLRAAAFDRREPLTAAGSGCAQDAVTARLGAQRLQVASDSGRLTADGYRRARMVVEHILASELAAPPTLLPGRYA